MKALITILSRATSAAFCLFATSTALAGSAEPAARAAIQQEVLNLFMQEDWQGLDTLADQYRSGYPATPGGAQKLVPYYVAIETTFAQSPDEVNSAADKWIAANPKSPSAYIVKAMAVKLRATRLRGEGPAESVNPAIIPEYKKILTEVEDVLQESKAVSQVDPMWYSQMIILAKLRGDSARRHQWLTEASERFPAFQNIYLEAMIGALPRWGGSAEEIEKIARLATEKTKEKSGLFLYTYIWYNALQMDAPLMPLLKNNRLISWKDMRQGWEDKLQIYPDQWSRNGYLATACLANDKETFNKQAALLEGDENVIDKLWLQGVTYQKCQRLMR